MKKIISLIAAILIFIFAVSINNSWDLIIEIVGSLFYVITQIIIGIINVVITIIKALA